MSVQITTTELRQAMARLLDHLDDTGRTVLTIAKDYYWSIPVNQRYDASKEPTEFTVGQLSDDWSELRRIIDGQSPPLGYALVWFGAVVRAIGEEYVE